MDAEASKKFIVVGIRDLNEEIETLEKGEASEEFKIGCMCFAEGPVTVKVTTPKTGFVCGEKVTVTTHVRFKRGTFLAAQTFTL